MVELFSNCVLISVIRKNWEEGNREIDKYCEMDNEFRISKEREILNRMIIAVKNKNNEELERESYLFPTNSQNKDRITALVEKIKEKLKEEDSYRVDFNPL